MVIGTQKAFCGVLGIVYDVLASDVTRKAFMEI